MELSAAKLCLSRADISYHDIMKIYKHISTWKVEWVTEVESIEEANAAQIQHLIAQNDEHPEVQKALRRMMLGNGVFLRVIAGDNLRKQFGHIVLGYAVNANGTRKVIVCNFSQCKSFNVFGLLLTLGLSGVVGLINPIAGILLLISKLAVDYAVTEKDVAVIAGMRFLEERGFVSIEPDHQGNNHVHLK